MAEHEGDGVKQEWDEQIPPAMQLRVTRMFAEAAERGFDVPAAELDERKLEVAYSVMRMEEDGGNCRRSQGRD